MMNVLSALLFGFISYFGWKSISTPFWKMVFFVYLIFYARDCFFVEYFQLELYYYNLEDFDLSQYRNLAHGIQLYYYFVLFFCIYFFSKKFPIFLIVPQSVPNRFVFTSVFIGFIGLASSIFQLVLLSSQFSLLELATSRALFSSDLNLDNKLFIYSRFFSNFLLISAVFLISFTKNNPKKLGYIFFIIQLFLDFINGGRLRLVQDIIIISWLNRDFILNHAIRFFLFLTFGLILLSLSVLNRFKESLLSLDFNLIKMVFGSIVTADFNRINDISFVMKYFESENKFRGFGQIFNSFQGFNPFFQAENEFLSLDKSLQEGLLKGKLWGGISGMNFSNSSEFFSWGGFVTCLLGPFFIFVLIYFFLNFMRSSSRNPLLSLFCIVFLIRYIIPGFSSRIVDLPGAFITLYIPFLFIYTSYKFNYKVLVSLVSILILFCFLIFKSLFFPDISAVFNNIITSFFLVNSIFFYFLDVKNISINHDKS